MRKRDMKQSKRLLWLAVTSLILGSLLAGCAASASPTATAAATPAPTAPAASATPVSCGTVDASTFVQPGTLTVSVSTTAPPLDFLDANGNSQGMYIDLVNLWAKDLGIAKVNLAPGAFSAMLPGLTSGRFDMGGAGVSQTDARKASKDFTLSTAYVANGATLVVKKSSSIHTWADMVNYKLGGADGEAEYTEAIAKAHPKQSLGFPGGLEARQALLNGQVDAIAGDSAELQYYISSAPEGSQLRLLEGSDAIIALMASGTVFRNQNTALIKAVNCEIVKELKDGTMAQMDQKWFGNTISVDNLKQLGLMPSS